MFFIFIIPVAMTVGVAFFLIKMFKQNKQEQAEKKYNEAQSVRSSSSDTFGSKTAMTDEQRRRLDYLKQQQAQRSGMTASEKHELHVEDAHEHGHTGEEEHYEEIVGSLGDINDEGCEDLSGVRFIAHDLAYDTSEDAHDYTELAKAIVVGDIINNPRYKSLRRP